MTEMQEIDFEARRERDGQRLVELASQAVRTGLDDPDLLDELAVVAARQAQQIRERRLSSRLEKINRIQSQFPDISEHQLAEFSDEIIADADAQVQEAAGGRERYQALKADIQSAVDRDAYNVISSLADQAASAQRSIEAALVKARDLLTSNPTESFFGSSTNSIETQPAIFDDQGPALTEKPSVDETSPTLPTQIKENDTSVIINDAASGSTTTTYHREINVISSGAGARQIVPPPEDLLPPSVLADPTIVWGTLRNQQLGLAYALLLTGAFGELGANILAPTIKLAAAALVADGSGAIDDEVAAVTSAILEMWPYEGWQSDIGHVTIALLFPTLSNLALLTPGAFTTGLLNTAVNVDIDTPSLHPLRELARVADTSQAQLGQATSLLTNLVQLERWQAAVKQYSSETEEWCRSQNSRQFRYAAATDLWRYVLQPDQVVGGWLQSITRADIQSDPPSLDDLNKFDVEAELRRLEPIVRGRVAARTRRIEGPAFHELCKQCDGALERIRAWLGLLGRRPLDRAPKHDGSIADLRATLFRTINAARHALSELTPPADAVSAIITTMLGRLEDLLEAKALRPLSERIDERLGRDLIACPAIKLAEDWRPVGRIKSDALPALIEVARSGSPELLEVCSRRVELEDFVGATLALGLETDEAKATPLRDLMEKAFSESRDRRSTSLEKSRSDVELAERAGRLETGEAQELFAELESASDRLKEARLDRPTVAEAYIAQADSVGNATRLALSAAEEKARRRIKLRLDRISISDLDRARIEQALTTGQFAIAEDLVDRLEAGDPIDAAPPPTVEPIFRAFFPERNESLAAWRAGNGPVLRNLAKSPLAVPPGQRGFAEDIVSCIDSWTNCASEPYQHLARDIVTLFAQVFGFTEPELIDAKTPKSGATEAHFRLRARVLRERGTSVLPEFGSLANGSYAVLCVWKKRDVQDIVESLARQAGNGPTIVLFFGPLDSSHRQRLATMARTGRLRSTIVVDELLALHLASLESGRLTALFACTLPFTDTQPWAETGPPPPEMFFGRQLELRDIETLDGGGAHLIYGGRQLGKTALLRQVIERNGEIGTGTIAIYVSIAQLGVSSQVDALWGILAEELSRRGVSCPQNPSDPARTFATAMRAWLDVEPARRIILLLDEADEFFRNDRDNRAPFAVTRALSELSSQTNRRFKPVFAGLRNVQKLARDPNSPLAHLGTPRVVGPLMRGQEREQAEQLVRWPFAALGYRLDDEVVTRILAFANYYPSLIQVVCQRLLRVLRERQGNGPPWTVSTSQVSGVLEAAHLRAATFERFRITLELDPRYQLLTLIMADLSRNDPQMLAEGIEAGELREWAAGYWPQGFPPDFSHDAFDAILSEMVGLGLLRDVRGTRVAIRSSNLAHLIGSQEKIKADLEGFFNRPGPSEADPAQARRIVNDWPSVLTGQQEGVLTGELRSNRRDALSGCIVLAGLAAANIASADACIRNLFGTFRKSGARAELLISNLTRIDHEQLKGSLTKHEGEQRPVIWIVKPEAEWTADTVSSAAKLLASQPPRHFATRVIFIADAVRAWRWTCSSLRLQLIGAEDTRTRVKELCAGPWSRTALDLWLKDHTELALPPQEILKCTGGWDRAIEALSKTSSIYRDGMLDLSVREALVSDLRGLDEAVKVLNAFREVSAVVGDTEAVGDDAVASWDSTLSQERVKIVMAWAQLVGVVQPNRTGLELNALISEALSRPIAL